ncbi:MAG: response regulator [Cyanobacteria bacterium P01_D01_bin.123]
MSTVLLVDDTLSQLELLSGYLRSGGFTVVSVSDAKDALAKVEQVKPDAIVTDLVMPGMSGLEFCRNLKKNPATESVPIVACSTKNQDIDRLWAMKQGVAAYVTKPCTQDELVKAVKSVV